MERTQSRRSLLAGTGLAVASAGCIGRVRNIAGRDSSAQLTLDIDTTPADDDPHGVRIARHLSEHLNAVGIDARVNTMAQADLRRRVLLNHDFDIYIGQYPEQEPFDPDALYSLTHSSFTAEAGWQNPFGITDLTLDNLLEEQRNTDEGHRGAVVDELQETICELQPFTVVVFPDALTAIREGRFAGWEVTQPISPRGLLKVSHVGDVEDDDDPVTLRLTTTDDRITENWNPIAAEYRGHGTFTSLLYDPLVRLHEDEPSPWMARYWNWTDPGTLRVNVREAEWHDGEPLTAGDVAFTYKFLNDTSLGNMDSPVPAPKFRGRSSLVRETTIIDDRTIDLTLGDVNRTVGQRALQVPILPEHVWSERTDTATIAGIEVDEETTEALVLNNENPVGSGPIRFRDSTAEEDVTFERNEDHFLTDESPKGIPRPYHGKPAFDRLAVNVVPSDIAAVQQVGDGIADATASNLGPDAVPRIGREADARLVSTQSAAFYHAGYNVRRSPLSNPRFRAIIASLFDKPSVVTDTFQGYGRPATSPLAASPEWVPDSLRWNGRTEDPVYPFREEDGELDDEAVRDAFREAGYRYNEAGELLSRDQ